MLSGTSPALDAEARISYISSARVLQSTKFTPQAAVYEGGEALAEGGALPLLSREALGLFSQYAAIGTIYGTIPTLAYPIFNNYLKMEGYQVASYNVLVTLGWSFKVFWGMCTDCMPIFGYRRKPWMLIGWAISMVSLAIMAASPLGDPYCFGNEAACAKPFAEATAEEKRFFNVAAPANGAKFIVLSMVTSIGYVMAACASDAMVVQYAQREPVAIRGRIQTAIYVVRTVAGIFTSLITAFGLNGKEYSGNFDFAMGPNVIYGILLFPCGCVCITTIFLVEDQKAPRVPFGLWARQFWDLLQMRVMWQVCAFRFINTTFLGIGVTATPTIQRAWAKVQPLNDSLSTIVGNLLFAGILVVVGKWGLDWNWRWTIALGTVAIVAIDSFVVMFTVWNVFRNEWFFTGVALSEQVPSGIRFIVSTYCAVEIADAGNEGATYGLVTTVSNLATPFASLLYKLIDSYFDVDNVAIQRDDQPVRWAVTHCYLISYGFKLASLGWLVLLPPQKAEMQALKRLGGRSKCAGATLVVVFALALVFSVTTNLLSIFPSTKCLRIAGGKGCP
ncbi:folate-Biopterin Transporter (FBT) family [Achlya hypogyna]|uniref:Folate-Biopterin Transporter (FBT) family n=1 Tax=Achlya hypogyna TaxID=1202772 RepID=A0A1V9ZG34_ACHHY|nr:folate-Biopterin Transporter (FBT) family [Achlya hypogyna]